MTNDDFIQVVKDIIYNELKSLNLLNGQWHLGKVTQVIDSKKLRAKVDGSSTDQLISSNPDVTFNVNDEIWIVFINGDSKTKFAISRRAV